MREIISVLAPGFSDNPDQQALAVELSRITFPYLFCMAIVTQLSSMLNAVQQIPRRGRRAHLPQCLDDRGLEPCAILSESSARGRLWRAASRVCSSSRSSCGWPRAQVSRCACTGRAGTPRCAISCRALGAALIGAGSVADRLVLRHADRQLPARGRSDVALLRRPHEPASHGHRRCRARHRAAARDVGGSRATTKKGASIAQNRAVVLGLLLTLPCIAAFFIIPELLMRALFARGAFNVDAADQAAAALVAYGSVCRPSF